MAYSKPSKCAYHVVPLGGTTMSPAPHANEIGAAFVRCTRFECPETTRRNKRTSTRECRSFLVKPTRSAASSSPPPKQFRHPPSPKRVALPPTPSLKTILAAASQPTHPPAHLLKNPQPATKKIKNAYCHSSCPSACNASLLSSCLSLLPSKPRRARFPLTFRPPLTPPAPLAAAAAASPSAPAPFISSSS